MKPRLDIAVGPLAVGLDVGQLDVALGRVFVRHGIFVKERRAWGDRFNGIGDVRQFLIVDVDEMERLRGDLVAISSHGGHRLADVAHAILRQKRHVFHSQADHDSGDIGTGDETAHARQLCGFARVDAEDARVGQGGAQHLRRKGGGKGQVCSIAHAARYFLRPLDAGHCFVYAFIGHRVSPPV